MRSFHPTTDTTTTILHLLTLFVSVVAFQVVVSPNSYTNIHNHAITNYHAARTKTSNTILYRHHDMTLMKNRSRGVKTNHYSLTSSTSSSSLYNSKGNNDKEEEVIDDQQEDSLVIPKKIINKPISLPSLENPKDAGPLFNTCRSSTMQNDGNENVVNDNIMEKEQEEIPFIPNKPIELDSLNNNIDRSFLGLQPRSTPARSSGEGTYDDEEEVPLLMETGLGVFTSSLILGGSIYFILAVFLDADNVDPTAIPLSF